MRIFRRGLLATAFMALAALPALAPYAAQAQDMPPLPAAIKSQGVLRVGVRCDQPPYGFRGADGSFQGVEVEMARKMADWAFGSPSKVQLDCVTAQNRIPQLNAGRVDMLIATLGITPERASVIDFSNPYRWGTSGLLVMKNSPIHSLDDLKGKTVIMQRGSTQAQWFDQKMPDVQTLRLDGISDGLQALKQGRGDAFSADDASLVVIAANDPTVRRVVEYYGISEAAIGLRKNDAPWKAWVNAGLARMKKEDLFNTWVKQVVPANIQDFYLTAFNKPTPKGR